MTGSTVITWSLSPAAVTVTRLFVLG
jgi:hypothetical protein